MTFESLNLQDENSDLNKIRTTRKYVPTAYAIS